jgi:hypothetical protein
MTATKMPDGSTCYTGPTCKKHGFYYSLQKKFGPLLVEPKARTIAKAISKVPASHFPDATPSKEAVLTGFNADPAVKPPELQQLDIEADYFKDNYSEDLVDTVRFYSSNYEYLNMYLRDGEKGISNYIDTGFSDPVSMFGDVPAAKRRYEKMAINRVEEMDAVFAAYKRPENNARRLYRTVQLNDDIKQLEVGDSFTDKSYMSTSLDPDLMLCFNGSDKESVVYEIISRNGVPVHKSEDFSGSVTHAEREVLLNRDSKFTVVGKRQVTFKSSYPDGRPKGSHYLNPAFPKRKKITIIQMVEDE